MNRRFSLKSKKQIRVLFASGSYKREGFLSFKYMPNRLEQARILISVSKKYSKKAVCRNRLKRLIREAVNLSLSLKSTGIDLAIFVPSAVTVKNLELPQISQKIRNFEQTVLSCDSF